MTSCVQKRYCTQESRVPRDSPCLRQWSVEYEYCFFDEKQYSIHYSMGKEQGMEKRIKKYLLFLENLKFEEMEAPELERVRSEMERQIGFFQHERLIHLIVTVLFALSMILVFGIFILSGDLYILLLLLLH